jgi:hypothetical protein
VAAAWFVVVSALAAIGVFTIAPALAAAIVAPVAVGVLAARRSASFRALVLGIPLWLLVAVHAGRLLGAFFLALHAEGRLPATFARSAGWGDIAVALLAIPVAWMAARHARSWRTTTLVWNALAFVDLVMAVTLGLGSTPGSPLRFIFEDTVPGTMAMLPWVLIPGYLVPMYLLAHVAVFTRLALRDGARAHSTLTATPGRA